MSNVRGLVPLLLATGLGVVNGFLVFGPAFKEQQDGKEQMQQALEVARQSESGEVNLRDAEAAASRDIATKSALKAEPSLKSSWSSFSLWSKETNASVGKAQDKPCSEDNETKKENQ